MGTSSRFVMESLYPLACDSASVLEGAVLVQGASNDTCALPSGASSRQQILGLCYQDFNGAAGSPVTIVAPGAIFPGIAAGSITRGDVVVIGGATGTVVSVSATTPVDATRVGVAMESVSSGERVAILIGASQSFAGTVIPLTSGAAITANTLVIAAGASTVIPTAGASPTAAIVGVALNAATGAGQTVYVCTSGRAYVTDSGAGVTANDFITSGGATGLGAAAALAGGTNCAVVGIALATTAASGSIPVSVCPSRIQG